MPKYICFKFQALQRSERKINHHIILLHVTCEIKLHICDKFHHSNELQFQASATQLLQIIQFFENIGMSKLPFLKFIHPHNRNHIFQPRNEHRISSPSWLGPFEAKQNRPRLTRRLGVNRWATRRKICRHISHLDRKGAKRRRRGLEKLVRFLTVLGVRSLN